MTGTARRSPAPPGRARMPDATGEVDSDGVAIHWERFGDGPRTVMLLPSWSAVPARIWKLQIPYLADRLRVIVFDGRGHGRSGRPVGAEAYTTDVFADDALAVLDATGTETASLVGISCGALWATIIAAEHPERIERIAYISPAVPLVSNPERERHPFDEPLDTDEGWAKYNAHYWRREYAAFLEWFAGQCFSEEHSTKGIEDFIAWGEQTTPETLADATRGLALGGTARWIGRCATVRCPTLVIHGDADRIRPHAQGAALAEATGGRLVTLEGSGHLPNLRDPVRVNLLLGEFLAPAPPPVRWRRGPVRARRALYVSSPIGLGHARRDLAIASELRRLAPELQIDWLAQHPVTTLLEAAGESIHPASARLAGESAHIAAQADGHALDCFEAIRRMDEILLANFMVFDELTRDGDYDLWIGDEAWELDHFLHENPERKTAAFAWLTDFVGWLPSPAGGEREARLTADYNAEMIEHVERHPRVRDRAIFVGDPDDVVADAFGPGLPAIRAWTEAHFTFSGYVLDREPPAPADRPALRAELGFADDERVCIVAVGGSGVGEALLARVIAAHPVIVHRVPDLRMIVVAGPRIDAEALSELGGGAGDGPEIRGFVPDLHRHLAACDVAVVQGGLATTMELAAARRPFVYVPLERHFEQQRHVAHRLDRHRAGRRVRFADASPEALADAIAAELDRGEVDYRPVDTGGAARAAALIAELL